MREELIGKVRLNLDYYDGSEPGTVGALEDKLLPIVREGADIEEYLLHADDGNVLYQLSDIRKNLLRWYGFEDSTRLLEIGSGCGAITGLFCSSCAAVTAIEPSKKRSEINAYRNKNSDNLEIIVGKPGSIRLEDKYDCITLIGALDTADSLVEGDNPQAELLGKARELLKTGGLLIIATDNKYALRSLSEARFDEQPDSGKRLSRSGLIKLMEEQGMSDAVFYYPIPDYRLPLSVYSEESLPASGVFGTEPEEYISESLKLFNERRMADELLKDDMYKEFANSFLVFWRKP